MFIYFVHLSGRITMSTRIGIIGASGYTGCELMRLLSCRSDIQLTAVTSRQYAGTAVNSIFPSLHAFQDLKFMAPDLEAIASMTDLLFTAVPHKTAMEVIPFFIEQGKRVIDLSADFRIRDRQVYEEWYQPHSAPEYLETAVYGLPELYREKIATAKLVANPGCYPTSSILPLAPLLKRNLIDKDFIIIDSKSGTSGAGRGASVATLFCEVNEGFKAYKIGKHRHTPEIEQELSAARGERVNITFTPHLVPMNRGILSTIYARTSAGTGTETILSALRQFYRHAPFVRILEEGVFPNVQQVRGSNYCDIGAQVDENGQMVMVSVIDNLTKGASGQAIQNMNIMLGLPETTGIDMPALYP